MIGYLRLAALYGPALFISAIFLDSLRFKFAGHDTPRHIFTTLRDWSGIDLFYPAGPWIIGVAELASALLLVAVPALGALLGLSRLKRAASQALGAAIALGVMSGAIGFHLFTPLGVATPTQWSGGVPTAESPALFIAACLTWAAAAAILALRAPELAALAPARRRAAA